MNKFFAIAALSLMLPAVSHASEKYVCSISPHNGIGIGIEIDIEVLSADSANFLGFQTSEEGLKVPGPMKIDNPGQLTRTGDILHLENVVHSIPPNVANPPPEVTAVAAAEINLSTMKLSFPKANRPDMTIPCVLSK